MTRRHGFLAIWCEIGADDLDDYRAWLTREHIADRIFLPGFLGMRLFASPGNECAHFFLYLAEGLHVFSGEGYRKVLDSPSPWTKRLMPRFGAFDRAIGEQAIKIGLGFGSHVAVARVRTDAGGGQTAATHARLRAFLDIRDVVGVRWLVTDRRTTGAASREKTMRTAVASEGDFDYLLVVEAMSESGAAAASSAIEPALQRAIEGMRSCEATVRKVVYGQAPYEGEAGEEIAAAHSRSA
jgi:hypothetical protein